MQGPQEEWDHDIRVLHAAVCTLLDVGDHTGPGIRQPLAILAHRDDVLRAVRGAAADVARGLDVLGDADLRAAGNEVLRAVTELDEVGSTASSTWKGSVAPSTTSERQWADAAAAAVALECYRGLSSRYLGRDRLVDMLADVAVLAEALTAADAFLAERLAPGGDAPQGTVVYASQEVVAALTDRARADNAAAAAQTVRVLLSGLDSLPPPALLRPAHLPHLPARGLGPAGAAQATLQLATVVSLRGSALHHSEMRAAAHLLVKGCEAANIALSLSLPADTPRDLGLITQVTAARDAVRQLSESRLRTLGGQYPPVLAGVATALEYLVDLHAVAQRAAPRSAAALQASRAALSWLTTAPQLSSAVQMAVTSAHARGMLAVPAADLPPEAGDGWALSGHSVTEFVHRTASAGVLELRTAGVAAQQMLPVTSPRHHGSTTLPLAGNRRSNA